jgi:hypothetical protein
MSDPNVNLPRFLPVGTYPGRVSPEPVTGILILGYQLFALGKPYKVQGTVPQPNPSCHQSPFCYATQNS